MCVCCNPAHNRTPYTSDHATHHAHPPPTTASPTTASPTTIVFVYGGNPRNVVLPLVLSHMLDRHLRPWIH